MNTTQYFTAKTVPTKEPSTLTVYSFFPSWRMPHCLVAQVNDTAVLSMQGVRCLPFSPEQIRGQIGEQLSTSASILQDLWEELLIQIGIYLYDA